MSDPDTPTDLGNDVTHEGVFQAVQEGYQAVYDALPHGETFNRIWREKAYRAQFPVEFAHIGFLTLTEARQMLGYLDLTSGGVLVDLACGAGGPGLWAAQASRATLVGIDPTDSGLVAAQRRAAAVGLSDRSTFQHGTFTVTNLSDATADAIMTVEAFQYAPDKRDALREFVRILKPRGRVAIVCFEVDSTKVSGLPVLGVDPVADYAPLLREAGLSIVSYEETPGWADRVYPTFAALMDSADALNAEMGEAAAASVLLEATLTVSLRPYPRRVLIVAELADE